MGFVINPAGLAFVLFMGALLLFVPKKYAMMPILAVALYIPMDHRIIVAGFDFYMLRIIFIFGWVRILTRSESRCIRLNRIDKIVIIQVIFFIVLYTMLWGTTDAFVNRLGQAYTLLSMYFIPRILINDLSDTERIVKWLLMMSIPIAICMVLEQTLHRNILDLLGAQTDWAMIREGKLRAQATFPHAILAGDFGASLLPLIVGLWWSGRLKKLMFLIGIISTLVIVITSNSSGPFVSLIAGIIGIIFWQLHSKMKVIFWGVVAVLLMLHFFIMKAPVWALIGRLGSSGSAYHRAQIVDQTINHFSEWWLMGTQTTVHWGHLNTMGDIANFYCRIAVDSGLVGLILFITVISLCFKSVGKTIRNIENQPKLQKFIWAIGVSLFAHTMAFIGVSYAGVDLLMLYMTFAILSTISLMEYNPVPIGSDQIFGKEVLHSRTLYGKSYGL